MSAGYNPVSGGSNISVSLHPLRWALILAITFPGFLILAFFISKSAGHDSLAHQAIKSACYLFGAEVLTLVFLAAIGIAYEHRAEKRDQELYPPPGKLVDVGGYRLHLHCSGKGPTVVLEYGQQGNYTDWHRVQPQIAQFARVCVYDRAGYGWSDPSPKPRVPNVMAEELRTLLHAAGEPPPYILVGHSFGGVNALMFAQKFPIEVAGVVLVDASLPEMMSRFRWQDATRLRSMQMAVAFGLARWRGWCGGSASGEIRGLKQAITCRSSLYETYYREWPNFPESANEIRSITSIASIPMVVIARDPAARGNSDRELEWNRLQRERVKLSSNGEFLIATGSGHDVPMERPDVIIEAVRRVLNSK